MQMHGFILKKMWRNGKIRVWLKAFIETLKVENYILPLCIEIIVQGNTPSLLYIIKWASWEQKIVKIEFIKNMSDTPGSCSLSHTSLQLVLHQLLPDTHTYTRTQASQCLFYFVAMMTGCCVLDVLFDCRSLDMSFHDTGCVHVRLHSRDEY